MLYQGPLSVSGSLEEALDQESQEFIFILSSLFSFKSQCRYFAFCLCSSLGFVYLTVPPSTKGASAVKGNPRDPPLSSFDGLGLGEPIILPHSLKTSTARLPVSWKSKPLGELCSPPALPASTTAFPGCPSLPLCSLAGPGEIKGTDDSAWCPFVTRLEGTSCSVNSQAWSRVS